MFGWIRDLFQNQTHRANWVIIVDDPKTLWEQIQAIVAETFAVEEVET